jgi:hypothetical protein
MRRPSAVRRVALAGLGLALASLGLTVVGAAPAHADGAMLTFSGPVQPHAFSGHVGLDALDASSNKICFAPNTTACPGGYSSVTDWDAAGNLPSINLPAGTATAHLELYPQTRYFDRSAVDPWGDGPGGTHIWVRDLQPGEVRDIGSIPLPNSTDPRAVRAFGNLVSTAPFADGRVKIDAYQITGLQHTTAGVEIGSYVESFSRGAQWTLGWAWPGSYVAYITDNATNRRIEAFFDVTSSAPALDLDAVCFGLDACQYQTGSPGPATGNLHPLAPARVLDTRGGIGHPVGPVRAGDGRSASGSAAVRAADATNHELVVAGRGGVPATGVSAVLLNVTATGPSDDGYLAVYPKLPRGSRNPANLDEVWDDQSSYVPGYPSSSNLNFRAGEVVPNLVLAPVGAGGKVRLNSFAGTVDVVADVVGWFDRGGGTGTGDGFTGVTPARLLDTRDGTGGVGGRFGSGTTRDLPVAGHGGVPASATAAVLNVTAVDPSGPGYVTVWPAGQPMPLASSLNTDAGRTRPNLVVAKLGADRAVSLFDFDAVGGTDLVVDVVGFFGADGGQVTAVDPQRLLDSRSGLDTTARPFGSGEQRDVQVAGRAGVPPGASAVVLNVTATEPTAPGFLTAWPAGQPRPLASTLNFAAGDNVANLVMVGLGPGGTLSLYQFGGSTHVVADVVGYVNG